MKLTRERKIYGGVLLLALAGLGASQFFGGAGEAAATAAPEAQPPAANSVATTPPPSIPQAKAAEPSLAQRLSTAARQGARDSASLTDPFVAAWEPHTAPAAPATRPSAVSPSAAELFGNAHSLSAVLVNAGGSFAMINGRSVRLGATIDGFRLISVDNTSATLASGQHQVTLRLPAQPAVSAGDR